MLLDGRPHLCRIPYVPPDSSDNSTASESAQAEQQQDLVRASDHGWKLLSDMQGTCLYYLAGWWVYSFCYNDGVNQFHPLPPNRGFPPYPPTPDPATENFRLGSFKKEQSESKEIAQNEATQSSASLPSSTDISTHLQTRGESNFLVQKLGGGTVCDLTGEPRQIEVQYHCNPNFGDRINMIKETSTCAYLMVIHTPRLCNEVAFLPPQTDKPNLITCQEIVTKDEEADWKKGKAAQASYELFKAGQEQENVQGGDKRKNPIIGGIELGGQKLVGGSPERTIKASKIARPPKAKEEKYIATLASSDGKYTTIMNEREIRKHSLKHTLDEIEDYIVQTEEWASNMRPGQPWKLDVVQTAEGQQYRGILMADDEEEKKDEHTKESEERKPDGSQEEYKEEKKP